MTPRTIEVTATELMARRERALDRSGEYLKTSRTDFRIFSTIHRTPLLRLEYDSDARVTPAAQWQFHAERGAFVHL